MRLVNIKFSLSLRILGLDHYQFPCSRQAFAYVVSRNTPFDLIHLFTRALLNSHWFCHYNEHHFFHAYLIINYLIHSLWQVSPTVRLYLSIHLCLIHNTLACHFEFHLHQQASFGYTNKFFIVDTYPNFHGSCCLLIFSY